MKKVIGYFILLLTFLFLGAHVSPAFAQPIFCTDQTQISTAIGCVSTNPAQLVSKVFTVALGIAGGIAFLLILLGALQVQTSAGNPERLSSGRETIEGAIIGLLLIILSVFILRVIGVDILGIPGFQ